MGFADSVLEPSTRLTSVGKTGLLCFLYSFVFSSPVFIQSRAQLLKPLTPNNNEYMLYGDQDPELDEFYGVFRKYWAEAEGHDGYMDPEILEDTKGFKNGDEEMEAGEGQGAETPTPPQAASSVMPPPPVPAKKDQTPTAEQRLMVQQRIQELKFLSSIGFSFGKRKVFMFFQCSGCVGMFFFSVSFVIMMFS